MPNTQQKPFSKILVADDDPSVLSSMESVFAQFGYSVRSADNGLSALIEIEREIPDTLVSDLYMPRMSGQELLAVVQRHFPSIYLIAMSGKFSGDEVPSGLAADAFYQKGSGLRRLLKLVENSSRLRRAGQPPSSALLWILRNEYNASGYPCVFIDCPDCHRTFEQQIGGSLSLVRQAQCPRCFNSIYYAIVQPVDFLPHLLFRRFGSETDTGLRS